MPCWDVEVTGKHPGVGSLVKLLRRLFQAVCAGANAENKLGMPILPGTFGMGVVSGITLVSTAVPTMKGKIALVMLVYDLVGI